MTNIEPLLERIAAIVRNPSLRTGIGSSCPVLHEYPPVESRGAVNGYIRVNAAPKVEKLKKACPRMVRKK